MDDELLLMSIGEYVTGLFEHDEVGELLYHNLGHTKGVVSYFTAMLVYVVWITTTVSL